MNPNLPELPAQHNEELTLRDLVARLREYAAEMRRCWKLLTALCIVGVSGMLTHTLLTPRVYPAVLTFMVREDSGGGAGGLASVLGQFGLVGVGAGEFNLDKIGELARSQRILRSALFDSTEVRGRRDLIANHILDLYQLGEKEWRKSPALRQLRFHHISTDSMTMLENLAFKLIYDYVVHSKDKLVDINYSTDTGIITLTVTSTDQYLSVAFCQSLYRHLHYFYVDQSTAQSRQTVKNLQARADSVRALLTGTERRLARTEDRSLGLLLREDKVPQKRMASDIQMLNVMYAEVVKNLEAASFLLKNSTPIFLDIDQPMVPIIGLRMPLTRSAAFGFIAGFMLGVLIILVRKFFRNND